MDFTPTPTTLVFLVNQDVVSAHLLPTVLSALLWLLPMETDHAHVPTKLTSLFLMVLVIALLAANTAKLVLMLLLVPLVSHHTPKQPITNVSAVLHHLLIQTTTVSLVPMAAKIVLQLQSVTAVSVHLSFKVLPVKLPAIMVSVLSVLLVLDVLLDVCNVLKIYNATTVLMDTTCIMEDATPTVLLALSVIRLVVTGIVFPATHHARPVSTTPHTVPVVLTEWDTFKLQPSNNHVS